ncbi:hypothetical protein PVAND_008859 [Polypedilum vanderplanki]|uniref:Uncharacterized protein n=1 Tax=Polypedilum vanderplanki TaxID=319348 RepID=A0A9J6CBN8_POLVA|nr:hypothetical protein PVAND_008859 [Polypedilum vanderplanki]
MLSNQMLNGIPEVQLGIDTKINNIEATEEAIQKIIDKEKYKKELPSHFVPINYAVNFDQHQKFDVNRQQVQRKKQEHDRDESNINFNKKATDDFHYDKFRKQFRK